MMNREARRRRQRGLSLMEVVLVVAIVAVTSALVYTGIRSSVDYYKETARVRELVAVCKSALTYYRMTGQNNFDVYQMAAAGVIPNSLRTLYSVTPTPAPVSVTGGGHVGINVDVELLENGLTGMVQLPGVFWDGSHYHARCATSHPALNFTLTGVIWTNKNIKTAGGPGVYPGINPE